MSKSKKDIINKIVTGKIERIKNQGKHSAAILAELRRGIGKEPGDDPELLGFVLENVPENFLSNSDIPTKEENAIYIAITLFALHQQGSDIVSNCMNADVGSFGNSLKQLTFVDSNASERIEKRLKAFAVSHDINEAAYYLRQMVQLLKSAGVKVNYAELAADLYTFQTDNGKRKVFLRWGQDFYRTKSDKNKEDSEK